MGWVAGESPPGSGRPKKYHSILFSSCLRMPPPPWAVGTSPPCSSLLNWVGRQGPRTGGLVCLSVLSRSAGARARAGVSVRVCSWRWCASLFIPQCCCSSGSNRRDGLVFRWFIGGNRISLDPRFYLPGVHPPCLAPGPTSDIPSRLWSDLQDAPLPPLPCGRICKGCSFPPPFLGPLQHLPGFNCRSFPPFATIRALLAHTCSACELYPWQGCTPRIATPTVAGPGPHSKECTG